MSSVGSAGGKISVRARKRNSIYDPDVGGRSRFRCEKLGRSLMLQC
jgi:hypothetical protein